MFLIFLTFSCLCRCSAGDYDKVTLPDSAEPEFVINTDKVLVSDFKGFGTQYNQNLYASISSVDGINAGNLGNLESKVIRLNSHFVRVFFDSRAWDTVNYPDYMQSFVKTIELAQSSGSAVNITYWHGPYTDISQQMLDFAKVVEDLVVVRKLSCVKSITIQNEVNSTAITTSTYDLLYRELDKNLKALGLRNSLLFIGGDLVRTNQKEWFDYMALNMNDVLDAYSIHIYWNYWDQAYGRTRITEVREMINAMPTASQKPVYITEYGIRGEKTTNIDPGCIKGTTTPIGTTNINAFQHAWFQILAMNYEFAGFIKWDAYKAKYDNGTQYHSLIGSGSEGYPLYPAWYSSMMFTRTSKPGWQLIESTKGKNNSKLVSALKDPQTGDLSIYSLNDTGNKTNFSISGLTAGKEFHFLIWNADGQGRIKDNGFLKANASGVVSFALEKESFAVLTTLNVTNITD